MSDEQWTRTDWIVDPAFAAAYKPKRTLLVGGDGIPVKEFLSRPVEEWLQA